MSSGEPELGERMPGMEQQNSGSRPMPIWILGFSGVFCGVLQMGSGFVGRAWIAKVNPQPEVIGTWVNLNLKVHLLMGVILFGSAIGILLMKEWGRRGMVVHAIMGSFWALGFALVSGTWAMATWDSGWEQSDDGTVVNMGGVSAFWIAIGAICWIAGSISVWWVLNRPRTREAFHFHGRGLSSAGTSSE